MRVAHFSFRSSPAKGGVEYVLELTSKFLAKKGYKQSVYTSRTTSNDEFANLALRWPFFIPKKKTSRLKRSERVRGVDFHRFDIAFRFYSYNTMKGLYEKFSKDVDRYDIVHLHHLNVYNNLRLAKIAHAHNVPVVLSCYDISPPESLPVLIRLLKRLYDVIFLRRYTKYVDKFLLLAKDQISEMRKLGFPKEKLQVWPPCFDIKRFRKKHKDEGKVLERFGLKRKQYVFNIGRIEEYKGVQDIPSLAQDFPKMKFVISGKDCGYLPALKKRVKELGLKNVLITGFIDDKTAGILMKNSKVFLFPSRKEGFGIVMVEAMSVGVPTIAYSINNVRNVISDGKTGFLVRSKKEMSKKLGKLLVNKRLYDRISKNIVNESEKYDYNNIGKSIDRIYKQMT